MVRKGQRRSSSGRRERNRSVTRPRRYSEKFLEAFGHKSRPRSMDDQVISLADGEESFIVYGEQGKRKIEAHATVIEQGKWQRAQTALYIRVLIKMANMQNLDKLNATFEFLGHGNLSDDRLPIYRSSPRRLYGVPQSVNEDYGRNTQFGGQAGTEGTNLNAQTDHNRKMNLTRDHVPKLEVMEMNHALSATLSKMGKMCSFESEFSVQIVVPYNPGVGVDVSCDIMAGSMEIKGVWRKIAIRAEDVRDEDYSLWTGKDWEKNGNCQGFYKNDPCSDPRW
ncbi:hypothetical protein BDV06DRAFT_90460 [Aspergillus oleicola]